MTARIIDGKVIAADLRARVAGEVARVKRENALTPGLDHPVLDQGMG